MKQTDLLQLVRLVRHWIVIMRSNQFWTNQNHQFSGSMTSTPLFNLNNVTVSFQAGKIHALKSVSLNINKGEVLFITGASGAGKTTLLNVLAGHQSPTRGKIQRPGRDLFTAQVFQDLRLLEDLTCEQNIEMAFDARLYQGKNEFYKDLTELAKVFGVWDHLGMKVKDANGGLKQKVAMTRALLAKPDILLADEPTSALDKDNANKLFEVLNFYNIKRSMTLVWATHSKELIKQYPGKIAHLDNGKIVYTGHACFI